MTPYTLGSGFCGTKGIPFAPTWAQAITKHIKRQPEQIIILGNQRGVFPVSGLFHSAGWPLPDQISLNGNLGHVGHLISGEKPYEFCGWSMTFLTLAMMAYGNETDFLFIEEDVLIKGDVLEAALTDLQDGQWIFGKKMKTPPFMPCAQGLVYVRHAFIPALVMAYIGLGADSKKGMLPEDKFCKIEEMLPEASRRLKFGYDREHPNLSDPVWYCQHQTPELLEQAIRESLG